MNQGEFQSGDWIPFSVTTGGATPAWATDASGNRVFPELSIFDANGDVVTRGEKVVPVVGSTGLHILNRAIGPEFSVGRYMVLVQWQESSNTLNRMVTTTFRVVPGGDSRGATIGIHHYRTPRADFVVTQSDTGVLEKRRGPKL